MNEERQPGLDSEQQADQQLIERLDLYVNQLHTLSDEESTTTTPATRYRFKGKSP